MNPNPSLLSIITYARSGALDYACRLFLEGGFELVDDEPAVLAVRGRLLKDRALSAEGAERRRLYQESADAYALAGEIGGQTYPLINAATLSLLAGHRAQSLVLAEKLFAKIKAGGDEFETPYYRAATHAEALLLLGKIAPARKFLAKAIALAPRAYEDHASTLRQFGMILDALGEDASWLDPMRPPRVLHFAAHGAAPLKPAALARAVRQLIARERIGYAYGALASAADLTIAETLMGEGVELHMVLPAPIERLRESLDRSTAFFHLLRRAASVRVIASASDPLSPAAVQLAAEVAMGCALMQAGTLMTEAVQFAVQDRAAARITALWRRGRRRQNLLAAPRAPAVPRRAAAGPTTLAAMLQIDLAAIDPALLSKEVLPRLARLLAKGPKPLLPPRWTGEAVLAAFSGTVAAAQAALAVAAALATDGARIAGHYGLVHRAQDAFSGKPFLAGSATRTLAQVVRSTPSGAVHLTEDFAAALHAEAGRARPRTEYVGDLPGDDAEHPIRLFSLKA